MASEDTVRRQPLTPFPPWMSNSDRECQETCEERRERDKTEVRRCGCGDARKLREVVHVVVLAMQFVTLLGVFCAWVGVAAWEGDPGSTFWKRYSDFTPFRFGLC